MKDHTVYYHLHTNTMTPCSFSKAYANEASNDWLCLGCNRPKPLVTSVSVTVEKPGPENGPLNFVYGFGVPLVRCSFLEIFDKNVIKRDLFLGDVCIEGSGRIDGWVTVRGRKSVVIRGTKNVSCRKCSDCGRDVYFAMGESYLFPEPSKDHDVFESDLFGLVISAGLFHSIALDKWSGLTVDKLTVYSRPRDGLGVLE